MTDMTPAEREERRAAQEARETQGITWLQVWQKAQRSEAGEFRAWALDSGLQVSGPLVDRNKEQGRRLRDRFEEDKARRAAEGETPDPAVTEAFTRLDDSVKARAQRQNGEDHD